MSVKKILLVVVILITFIVWDQEVEASTCIKCQTGQNLCCNGTDCVCQSTCSDGRRINNQSACGQAGSSGSTINNSSRTGWSFSSTLLDVGMRVTLYKYSEGNLVTYGSRDFAMSKESAQHINGQVTVCEGNNGRLYYKNGVCKEKKVTLNIANINDVAKTIDASIEFSHYLKSMTSNIYERVDYETNLLKLISYPTANETTLRRLEKLLGLRSNVLTMSDITSLYLVVEPTQHFNYTKNGNVEEYYYGTS